VSPSRATAQPVPVTTGGRRSEILDTAAGLFASSGYVHTSLRDVADACGIQAGSLYHHFDSKEALARELIARWHAGLAAVGRVWLEDPPLPADRPVGDRVVALGADIAAAAVAHRAGLHLSAYEPHTGASPELLELAAGRPDDARLALRSVLEVGLQAGRIRAGTDLDVLAEQLHETMLHVGMATVHRTRSGRATAAALCRMLLHGVAVRPPDDATLDASDATLAAVGVTRDWERDDAERDAADPRMRALREAARHEFARRGFEATAVRDIAATAGMAIGSVYKLVESKDALVASIMNDYHDRLTRGYVEIAGTGSSSVEKLDALTWFNVRALERFAEEFQIQRSWYRSSPPRASSMSRALRARLRVIADVVGEGERLGELHFETERQSSVAQCIRDLIWLPPTARALTTPAGALAHVRSTLLRGALTDA
jgi:AcrR family transcriptional regulator